MIKWPKQMNLNEDEVTGNAERKPLESVSDDADEHEPVLGKSPTIRIRAGASPEKPSSSNDKADEAERLVQRNIQACLAKQLSCCGEESGNCAPCRPKENNTCEGGPKAEGKPRGSGPAESKPCGSGTFERNSCGSEPPERKPCGNGSSEKKPCGSGLPERKPCGSGLPEKNPCESRATERNPCENKDTERNPCDSGATDENPCGSRAYEKNSCTSGPTEKRVCASKSKQRRPAIDPVDQIIEEGLQLRNRSRRSQRPEPNADEQQRRRSHRQSKSIVPRPQSARGYQPNFYDDSADMQNWKEHSNRQKELQKKQSSRDGQQTKRSRTCSTAGFVPYADDQPSSRSRRQQPVPMDDEARQIQQDLINVQRHRLNLLRSIERAHRALLAEVEEYEQPEQQTPEAEQQVRDQQSFDDQGTSSQYCGRNASAQRDPLPAPNRPATADQQRRKLYYRPSARDSDSTTTTEDSCDERTPGPAPAIRPKKLIPYQPPTHSDSSGSAGECDRQISPSGAQAFDCGCNGFDGTATGNVVQNANDYLNTSATTAPERRRRPASMGPQNMVRDIGYGNLQNPRDGGRAWQRAMNVIPHAVPSMVPSGSSGYYNNRTGSGSPHLMPQRLNFVCNCDNHRS